MDADRLQEISQRDQLWASLRELLPEIDRLASGEIDGSARQHQLAVVLARIVVAELNFRRQDEEEAARE